MLHKRKLQLLCILCTFAEVSTRRFKIRTDGTSKLIRNSHY